MKTTRDHILTVLLTPLSWLYGGVTFVRNWMFDKHILPEAQYEVPVVCVGNLTVGGTGKTPHVEMIVSRLSNDYEIAVLSRGYKRKTKGFIAADSHSTPDVIGDEPYQIYSKYGRRVNVAVCESRRKGIEEIMRIWPGTNLILLDDAFQHRWVKPKVSVLLTDYNRPVYNDRLLPLGRLRESRHAINRADIVIVTKCPADMQPIQYRLVSNELQLMAYQKLFFSRYEYEGLKPVFAEDNPYHADLSTLTRRDTVLLLTGIAHPRYFVRHFKQYPFRVRVNHFPDHHDFTRRDLERLKQTFEGLKGERKIILTTEKDAVRLSHNPYFPRELKPLTFYLPIRVNMVDGLDSRDFITHLRKTIDSSSTVSASTRPDTSGSNTTGGVAGTRSSDADGHDRSRTAGDNDSSPCDDGVPGHVAGGVSGADSGYGATGDGVAADTDARRPYGRQETYDGDDNELFD